MAFVNVAFFDLWSRRIVEHEVLSGIRREEAPVLALNLATVWHGGSPHGLPSPVFLVWESPDDLGIFQLDHQLPLSEATCDEIAAQVDALSGVGAPPSSCLRKTPPVEGATLVAGERPSPEVEP